MFFTLSHFIPCAVGKLCCSGDHGSRASPSPGPPTQAAPLSYRFTKAWPQHKMLASLAPAPDSSVALTWRCLFHTLRLLEVCAPSLDPQCMTSFWGSILASVLGPRNPQPASSLPAPLGALLLIQASVIPLPVPKGISGVPFLAAFVGSCKAKNVFDSLVRELAKEIISFINLNRPWAQEACVLFLWNTQSLGTSQSKVAQCNSI